MNRQPPGQFWPPLAVGIALGLVLLAMFLMTGHGLGASGFFKRMAAWLSNMHDPVWSAANGLLKGFLGEGHPFGAWIGWEIAGAAIGALVASLSHRRFQLKIERGARIGVGARLGLALACGLLTGFGVALTSGCTSGLGLSGGATLAVAAFVFLIAFFVAGVLMSKLTRGIWE